MFSYAVLNSFFQNYFTYFWFVLFLFVSLFSVCLLFRSFLSLFYFRYVCFIYVCIAINQSNARGDGFLVSSSMSVLLYGGVHRFSVENPKHYMYFEDRNSYVYHFSVENTVILTKTSDSELHYGNYNHLSDDSFLILLENISFNGEFESSLEYNYTIRTFTQFLKRIIYDRISKNSKTCFPLILCVIISLLRTFDSVSVKLNSYRIIETPRRVLIKRKRFLTRKSRIITLITLIIFVLIRSNNTLTPDESSEVAAKPFELVNNISSLFMASKGKPFHLNFFMLLILAGDIETNPGPISKPICEFCLRTIAKNHRFVKCAECSCKYHIKCADVPPKVYDKMKVDKTITFTCPPCISNTLPFADVDLADDGGDFVMPENIERLDLFKKSCLNIAHLNVNGLRSKLDFIKILVHQEKFDILCVNETKIDSTVSDSEIAIPGYLPYRQDRTLHGGGTIIYCSKNITAKKNTRLSSKKHEAVWVEVRFKKSKPIYVCSLYRPPSSKAIEHTEDYTKYLSSCIDNLQKNSEVFILGDFNVDVSKRNNLSSLIGEICKSKVLTQHVSSPTRVTEHSSTTIDLVLSNSKHAKDCEVVNLGISDHSLVYIRRERTKIDRRGRKVKIRSLKKFNDQAFLEDLGNLDWSIMLNSKHIDEAVEIFNANVLEVLNRHAPFIERRISDNSPPWVDEVLLTAIHERDYLKKIASRTEKNSPEWGTYQKKRNFVIKLKDRLKKEYYQKTLDDNKSQSRKLWKTLKTLVPDSKQSNFTPHSLSHNNKEISDKNEIASIFNSFFATIGSKLGETFNFSDTLHICPPVNKSHFSFSHVKLSYVQKLISNLDNNKATGLDGINVHALKSGSPILSYYLTHLFNLSLTTGIVPKCWKKKRVTPVFKKGDTDDVNNYRPISILPITMKIFEKVVHSQVSSFLDSSDILSSSQSGFRSSRSTDTAVICVSDFILQELGKKRYVGAVLVDLKKAFDTVDHKILLKKLFCYGLRDTSFSWFESYLSDRAQCTILEDTTSSFMNESSYGVPQGSVLGPLLFLIYINDVGLSIRSTTFHHLYADDTIIVVSSDSPVSLKTALEEQLSELGHWFFQNKLTVNTEKTEVIFFGRINKIKECKDLAPIDFLGDKLECKSSVKYLGVVFDERMSWDAQVKAVRKKAYFSLNKIKRVSPFLTEDTKRLLVNALVMPHLTYCCNSWSSMSKTNLNRFDSLIENVSRVSPLNKTFGQLVNYSKAIMTFKGIHKLAPSYLSSRFKLVNQRHERETRFSTQNNLVVPNGKTTFTQRTFLNSSTTIWNNLPVDLKRTKSFLQFKSSLKRHIYT